MWGGLPGSWPRRYSAWSCRSSLAGLGDRILLGMDDSPTSRYGRHVEGAGVHHNPTPGPADGKWMYGHNWVALAWLATHPAWGVIALPLRSMLYVREVDVPKLAEKYGWKFRTKHQLGRGVVDLVHAVDPRAGPGAEGVVGRRRRLCGATVSAARARTGHRGRQPLAQGRLSVRPASPRVLTATASTARTRSVWQSGPGIARAGRRSPTIAAVSR